MSDMPEVIWADRFEPNDSWGSWALLRDDDAGYTHRYISADIVEELAKAVAQYDNVTGSYFVDLAKRILQWTENADD